MSAEDSSDVERLARVMDVRRSQFAMRIVVAAVVAGLFFGFTGWIFATAWFSAYVALQLFELKIFSKAGTRSVSTPARRRAALCLLAVNTLLFGAFGFCEAMCGGSWGVACGCLLWASAIMNGMVVSKGCKSAFVYMTAPLALFYLTAPVFPLAEGAPWIDACAVILAGGLNLVVGVVVWSDAQKLYEAELLAKRELERKTAEAEAATAAKSAFVAMVSHELRTPISAILAGAAEVERAAGEPGLRSNGLLIADSARMMRTLLNDLLDLSKIEAGAMGVELIAYDARSLVLDTIRFWSKEVRKKGLRVRLQGAASLPGWVRGDPTRLRQILNNLFSNAIKFTRSGSITLSLSMVERGSGELDAAFEIIDTGVGMTAEQLGRLFRAFEQLGDSTARTHGGTGLGLAISRDLARLMGGDLTASSIDGKGSTFTLTLPLALAEAAVPDIVEVPRVLEAERPLRVLLADDHSFNRRAFTLMLDAVSADTTAVEDGLKALEALASEAYDVVLMDVNMPGMNGLEVVRQLRASSSPNAKVPVIALTAAGGADDIAACMAAGMDAFVAKPVESAELFAVIDQVLSPNVAEPELALSA